MHMYDPKVLLHVALAWHGDVPLHSFVSKIIEKPASLISLLFCLSSLLLFAKINRHLWILLKIIEDNLLHF